MTARQFAWPVAASLGATLFMAVWLTRPLWSVDFLVREGRAALKRQDPARALERGRRAVERAPDSLAGWRLLADAAERAEDRAQAVAALTHLTEADPGRAADYWTRIGALEMQRFRVRQAQEALRRSLQIDRAQVGAWRLRAQLAGVLGMSRELTESLVELIRQETFELNDLVLLTGFAPTYSSAGYVEAVLAADPNEVRPLLARAFEALIARRAAAAEQDLKKLVSVEPGLWEAQAVLGELYADRSGGEFLQWQAGLPSAADENAGIWLARGIWLRAQGRLDEACRCFWEALKRDPEIPGAVTPIGQILLVRGEVELGRQFLRRAELTQKIASAGQQIAQRRTLSEAAVLIDDLEAAGRLWEAWAWCSLRAAELPADKAVAARLAGLAQRLSPDLPRTLPEAVPGHDFDWSRFALPDWTSDRQKAAAAPPTAENSKIRFVDEAHAVGLDFQYVNDEANPLGKRIFQFTGGGVAALDYDGDGWTDLYFAQGGTWPVVPGRGPGDVLFRNRQGERFDDVTGPSGIVEDRFSQGVAAGDFDNDGFPDLYVANIGRNRLFQNNGDGTFGDVTGPAGLQDEAWTVSCAIADFDGDGLPDLFDVNYVQGAEMFTRICANDQGLPAVCKPEAFDPALDTVSRSRGDGRFVELQAAAGLNLPNGRGLGLVVADFDGDRRLDVFVANDGQMNYLLLNDPPRPRQSAGENGLRFRDEAGVLGVAFDRDGFSRANMGIACGDINGDGRLDLFVTTYSGETKELYLSQPDGSYVDDARDAGLYGPTLQLLGFGTQFLDADLDGLLDLVILNGHVDTVAAARPEYFMRPQFFRGLARSSGGPRFEERKDSRAGEFFAVKRLGRALARLDWNRDGLVDLVATCLEGPIALVTNRTQAAGNSLRVKLVGTVSSRDAIGARLRIVPGAGQEVYVQLTSGDGYEACNERLIQVGLGGRTHVEKLEIEWPSGKTSAFDNVACDAAWMAIEGAPRLTPLELVK